MFLNTLPRYIPPCPGKTRRRGRKEGNKEDKERRGEIGKRIKGGTKVDTVHSCRTVLGYESEG